MLFLARSLAHLSLLCVSAGSISAGWICIYIKILINQSGRRGVGENGVLCLKWYLNEKQTSFLVSRSLSSRAHQTLKRLPLVVAPLYLFTYAWKCVRARALCVAYTSFFVFVNMKNILLFFNKLFRFDKLSVDVYNLNILMCAGSEAANARTHTHTTIANYCLVSTIYINYRRLAMAINRISALGRV